MIPYRYRPEMTRYQVIDDWSKLVMLSREMAGVKEFAFDTETNTLKTHGPNKDFKCVGISISWGYAHNYYIPINHRRYEDYGRNIPIELFVEWIGHYFEQEDLRLIIHNSKFDMHVMARIGINIKTTDIWDTMIMSWLCNENTPNGLKQLEIDKLGLEKREAFKAITDSVSKEVKKEFGLTGQQKATFDLVLIDDAMYYVLSDAFNLWNLYLGLLDELEQEGMTDIYVYKYQPFLRALFDMEERGTVVDMKELERMEKEIQEAMQELHTKMIKLVRVDFSPTGKYDIPALLYGHNPYEEPDPSWQYKGPHLQVKEKDKNDVEKVAKAKKSWDNKWGTPELCAKTYKGLVKKYESNILKIGPILNASYNFHVFERTKEGLPKTDNAALWTLSQQTFKTRKKQEGVEFTKLLIQYKKLAKLYTAFIEGTRKNIYDDGKVHCNFKIIGTDSGRISCADPNLQQLPNAGDNDPFQIRKLYIGDVDEVTGERNKIIALDESNLEMRVLAHFSKDENLLHMFEHNLDTHGSTAVNMFNLDCEPHEVKKLYPHLRQAAKVINFLLMYGGGAKALYDSLRNDQENPVDLGAKEYLEAYHERDGIKVAQHYIDKYFSTYKGVAKFIENQKRKAHKKGFTLTLLGRKRRLEDINSPDFGTRGYQERLSVNSPVQGSAADIVMSAQIRVNQDPWFLEHRCYMLIQVHDEIVLECPEEYVEEAIARVKHYMEFPFGDDVRLNLDLKAEADWGDSYAEAK